MIRLIAILALAAPLTGLAQNRAANTVVLEENAIQNLRIETAEAEQTDFEETLFALGRIRVARLVPVLMTALSAGIALVPLVLAAREPGKEILHPVAVVICGASSRAPFSAWRLPRPSFGSSVAKPPRRHCGWMRPQHKNQLQTKTHTV